MSDTGISPLRVIFRQWRTIALLPALLAVASLRAQTQGEITGEVVDESGSVLPGASVTVTNQETNVSRKVVTNSAGIYGFPALMPGVYAIKTEMKGFQSVVRSTIVLQVQQVARIDFRLRVGQVTEVVEVSGAPLLLATENATIGTVIDNQRIVELPLNGRNYLQLVALSPNVSFGFAPLIQSVSRQGGDRPNWSISVAGQHSEFNNYTLDGVSNTDVNFNTYIFAPSIDALQEFKVQTGVYPAEFGRLTSQINVSTKGGTNAFHGALFEFFRNAKLDARPYSFTVVRTQKDPFVRNQYGFALGGPVWIPKLFNGKNRLFFMVNYEGLRDRRAVRRSADVPTDAMRRGDFSSDSAPIFDPVSRVLQANGTITAQAFPGNVIPTSRLNPKSQKLLEFLPSANVLGIGLSRNYQATASQKYDTDQFTTRIDFAESASSNWFGRYSRGSDVQVNPSTFPLQGQKVNATPRQVAINNARVFSPSVVNEFRFGYIGFKNENVAYLAGVRDVVAEIGGFAGVPPASPNTWGVPGIGFTGFSGFGDDANGPFVNNDHVFQWIDNVSIVRGAHSLRFGAEIRRDRFNQIGNQFSRGAFAFSGQQTGNPSLASRSGNGFADYMAGYIFQSQAVLSLANAQLRSTSQAYYIDDTWKVRPNLSISLGLRYELVPPYYHKNDGMMNLDFPSLFDPTRRPTLIRPGSGDFYQDMPFRFNPAIQVARDNRLGRAMVKTDYNNFAPRFGISYSPSQKWTFRTGFGVFYTQDIGNYRFDMARNMAGRRLENADLSFPNLTMDSPFGQLGSTVLVNNPLVLMNEYEGHTPYVFQYLFNIQRQLTRNTLIEVGYLGNVGHKLETWTMGNYPLPGPGNVQARRPFPELGVIQLAGHAANSVYNAGSVKFERRFSQGFTYLVSYTLSRSVDQGSSIRAHIGETDFPQNIYDRTDRRGLSSFHQKHRVATSVLWEAPIGRGKRLDFRRFGNAIAGAWQVGTILAARSGQPFTVTTGVDGPNTGYTGYPFPNATGISPVPPNGRDPQHYFNAAAFVLPPPFTYGNSARSNLIAPEQVSWDLSAMKSFPMPIEGHRLQFRFEAFNFPNRPNFGLPVASLTSTSFTKITGTQTNMRELQFSLKYVF
jgi:hypothetical protein